MQYEEYIRRRVVEETEKAYLVEQEVNNRRDGHRINFKWVYKNKCREAETGYTLVPEWLVEQAVW